ncbi:MAG TPA: SCP2 sterol-binding domain-containing protein [Polyangiaceae bacterium]|jgi:putative sterol carrier protein
MNSVPSAPEPFFTQYIPARFAALTGFDAISSPGSVVFAVPGTGSWGFRLRAGRLVQEPGEAPDVVVRITVPQESFEAIVVRGTERLAGLELSVERQMIAFRALTLDAERVAMIRNVKGSVSFAVLDGASTHRVYVTPGAAEPNLTAPECEVSCEADAFWGLQTGTTNPLELLMNGKLRIAGDAQIPMALSSLFV